MAPSLVVLLKCLRTCFPVPETQERKTIQLRLSTCPGDRDRTVCHTYVQLHISSKNLLAAMKYLKSLITDKATLLYFLQLDILLCIQPHYVKNYPPIWQKINTNISVSENNS